MIDLKQANIMFFIEKSFCVVNWKGIWDERDQKMEIISATNVHAVIFIFFFTWLFLVHKKEFLSVLWTQKAIYLHYLH